MSESGLIWDFIFNDGAWQEVGNKEQDRESGDDAEYVLSDDNNARFGKYLTPLSSLSDILNCERGDKELSSLEEEV